MKSVLVLYALSAITVISLFVVVVTANPMVLILSCGCMMGIGLWFMLAMRANEHS